MPRLEVGGETGIGWDVREKELKEAQAFRATRAISALTKGLKYPGHPVPHSGEKPELSGRAGGGKTNTKSLATSLRKKQCTAVMTKPCAELKTAKSAWNRTERRSVMARTADIQVSARRGSTTQELQSEALRGTAAESLSA